MSPPVVVLSLLALGCLLPGCGKGGPLRTEARTARFVRETPWITEGTWIKIDTHVHTEFSDGAHSMDEVVAKAKEFGCDAIAITDHCDRLDDRPIGDYVTAIDVARREFPEMVILTGVEWNLPPWGGDDHATVLFPPGIDEPAALSTFIERFDDFGREVHDPQRALDGFRWLHDEFSCEHPAVVMMNHTSRKNDSSMEIVEPIRSWLGAGDAFIGFSGAPGHQAGTDIGAYEGPEKTIDRWDPAAARLGDAWDTLLRDHDIYAALAPSDFHSPQGDPVKDYWPGEFSETWVLVPERSQQGILDGLRAGTFFANHGGICREARLMVEAEGLPRPAEAGEVIEVPAGKRITASLRCAVPETDLQGNPNVIDGVELIRIGADTAEVMATVKGIASGTHILWVGPLADDGMVLRARGYRQNGDESRWWFYTNPVRIVSP